MTNYTEGMQTVHDNAIARYDAARERNTLVHKEIKASIISGIYREAQVAPLLRVLAKMATASLPPTEEATVANQDEYQIASMYEIALNLLHEDVLLGKKIDITLYKVRKLQDKENRPINIGLLTPGSIVEYKLHKKDSPVRTGTVKSLMCNDWRSWVVELVEEEPDPNFDNEVRPITFNTGYIRRVIKHVAGHLKTQKDLPMRSTYYLGAPARRDGKYYTATSPSALVHALIVEMGLRIELDEVIDIVAFTDFLKAQGAFKTIVMTEWFDLHTAQKKRLRRMIRRSFSHFKTPQSKLLEIYIEEKEEEKRNYYADVYGDD